MNELKSKRRSEGIKGKKKEKKKDRHVMTLK